MATENTRVPTGFVGFVRQHPISAFVFLAYALSWWPWVWFQVDPQAVDAPILPFGPLLAVLIILALLGGWPAIRQLMGKCFHWRIGLFWYALALFLPFATMFVAAEINILLGASRVVGFAYPPMGEIFLRFVFIFLMIGVGEEIAWRGFLLDRLLSRHSAIKATLATAVIHIVWHAPLFGVEYGLTNILPWAATVLCFSIVIAWIYLRTGGSLLPAMLMHANVNTWAFQMGQFAGGDLVRIWWLWCALWAIVAIAVLAFQGPQFWREVQTK